MPAMTRSREQQLIALAAAGDRGAGETLIRFHQGSVYGYILRLSGRHDLTEDVVQEAFVRVLTNLDRFDTRFRFSTWLFTIARRVFLNAIEKRKPVSNSERVEATGGHMASVGRDVASSEHREVCRGVVERALQEVSFEQREVLVLFHQCEWPIWLIAEHLSKPEGTVKSHLHRGRMKLREALEKLGAPQLVSGFKEEATT